jgi:hypothetical protein
MQRIFIETTIQIQRLLHDPVTASTIQSTLQRHQPITSTYVWMEVQRTLGQDYQYLIDLLLHKQPTSLSEWLNQLGAGANLYSVRRLKRMLQILSCLVDDFKSNALDPIDTAYRLERKRTRMLHYDFFDTMTDVVNSTMCDLIQPDYAIPTGGRMSCRRETARCALPALLKNNAPLLHQLPTNPAVLAALESKTRRALAEVNIDAELAKGEQNCWSMGDLIIVLECPPDAALWTTNVRHFAPLCQAFGRQLFQPDAP